MARFGRFRTHKRSRFVTEAPVLCLDVGFTRGRGSDAECTFDRLTVLTGLRLVGRSLYALPKKSGRQSECCRTRGETEAARRGDKERALKGSATPLMRPV